MKKDIYIDKKFSFTHNIDEELLKPGKKLMFGGKECTLSQLNEILPPTENKINIFVEWDNMCQRTAFGLNTLLNEILEEDRKIDILKFFNRQDYPNGIDYVKNIIYNDCDNDLINTLISKKYSIITRKSPVTEFFDKLKLIKFMLSSVVFMFRYENASLKDFIKQIEDTVFDGKVRCDFKVLRTEEDEIKNIKNDILYDLYVVPDAGLYYKTLIDLDKRNTTILTYSHHNGINPYLLSVYINKFLLEDLPGPNGIIINFLDEIKNKKET